jgi:hypothetical protein
MVTVSNRMNPAEFFSHWDEIRSDLETTIEAFEQDERGWTPFEGS